MYWKSLPKCGIVRTFPITHRHLPSQYQGLNLPLLYLEQEIGKLNAILNFGHTESVVWAQLSLGFEHIQVHLGLKDILLNYEYETFCDLCPDCWIKTVWKFMSNHNLKIQGWKQVRPLQRKNDIFLMEEIAQHDISIQDRKIFNECRMYLQVETLSDIVSGDGKRIAQCYYNGRRDEYRHPKLRWPDVTRPNTHRWIKWKSILDKVWCRDKSVHRVHIPLTTWKYSPNMKWIWFFDPLTENLYQIVNDKIATTHYTLIIQEPGNLNNGSVVETLSALIIVFYKQ